MIIGITGNIGSGKSTASKILSTILDFKYIDLDVMAKVIAFQNITEIENICKKYGYTKQIYENFQVFLKIFYFSNNALKKEISNFIRPKIVFNCSENIVVESAILFEEKFETHVDKIVAVCVDPQTRYKRLKKSRNMNPETVDSILAHQTDEKLYINRADFVIDNSGSEFNLYTELFRIAQKI